MTVPLVLVGQVAPIPGHGAESGIDKTPRPGPWVVSETGLIDDAQADLKNHGGKDKAIHHYPREHYATWRMAMGSHELLRPGGFGENLSTESWTEADVCLGDVFAWGAVLLQISQGRQPCWKLNARFGLKSMARDVQTSGRTGWYYRVLTPGTVTPDAEMRLVERPYPQWRLDHVTALLYKRLDDRDAYAALADLPDLAQNWRELFAKRAATRQTEDWSSRLGETT